MSRDGGERAFLAPPPPPVPRGSPIPASWLFRSEMDLGERTRGSFSRSTLLLRDSILEADDDDDDEEGEKGEVGGGYREEDEEGWERMKGGRVAVGES